MLRNKIFQLFALLALASLACSTSVNVDGHVLEINPPAATAATAAPNLDAAPQGQVTDGVVANFDVMAGITLGNFPVNAYPVRWGETIQPDQKCDGPMVNWILCDPGVISFDYPNGKDELNPSAVWTGGAQVDNLMENTIGDYSCPESGYIKVTAPEVNMTWKHPVTGEVMLLSLKAQPGTSYTVVIQCAYDGEGDRAVKIDFTTSEAGAGNVKVMRYAVEAEHSGFFGYLHTLEDLATSRGGPDNCGNDGCPRNILIAIGMNEASFGVWTYNGVGLDLVKTNVVAPQ